MKSDLCNNMPLNGYEPLPFLTTHRADANGYIKGNQCVSNVQPGDNQLVNTIILIYSFLGEVELIINTHDDNIRMHMT